MVQFPGIVDPAIPDANAALVARLIRRIGPDRVLYSTDTATGDNLRPRASWAALRTLPLTEREFAVIEGNVAPCLR